MDSRLTDDAIAALVRQLLARRAGPGHWEGRLSSSALSTATAVIALTVAGRDRARHAVVNGVAWLVANQNRDGGWGDTVLSRSNISTTALVWSALSLAARADTLASGAINRAAAWLRTAAGDVTPDALRDAVLRRYGKDRTFSVPILMVLALAGKLGADTRDAWRMVPQLPFELAAVPHRWFQYLQLPVVSYALPALIAIGQARHHFAPTANPLARAVRTALRARTHDLLRSMQPGSGGYLEATPLTSFVVMSLAAMGRADSPVVEHGSRFLVESAREDGSWPIDTNLSTWVTTLSVSALADAGTLGEPRSPGTPDLDVEATRDWLLHQQSAAEHPFTHARPGAWAWTPLTGGVPDADDTAGALVALAHVSQRGSPEGLAHQSSDVTPRDQVAQRFSAANRAAAAGVTWLLGVQNRDGGIPTFCRGWGALPFDRSTPEITAHALQAWSAWHDGLEAGLRTKVVRAAERAVGFIASAQRPDGAWIPLWFGNEDAPGDENPTYGTSRVLSGLQAPLARARAGADACRQRGVQWLLNAQNADGGWGGDRGVKSSIEETGVALEAISGCIGDGERAAIVMAASRAASWLVDATARRGGAAASPVGLYFAKLWYFEELYPLIFALAGLAAARSLAQLKLRATADS